MYYNNKMNNLPNDIIFNICRFLSYPESKVFKNISLPIDRMILNSEFHKFYEAYSDIEDDDECVWCGYDRETETNKEMKFKKDIGYAGEVCFKCFYNYYGLRGRLPWGMLCEIRMQSKGINGV